MPTESSYGRKNPGGRLLLLLFAPRGLCLWALFLVDRGASLDSGF